MGRERRDSKSREPWREVGSKGDGKVLVKGGKKAEAARRGGPVLAQGLSDPAVPPTHGAARPWPRCFLWTSRLEAT